MSETFSEQAVRLSGFAGALWGWSAPIFWDATPGEFAVVLRAMMGEEDVEPLDTDRLAQMMEAFPDGR